MVINHSFTQCVGSLLLAQQRAEPVLEQLDPPRRAVVIMALLALVLTGMLLVAITMLGAHWVRRQARHQPPGPRLSNSVDAVARRRLRDLLQPLLPEAKSDDTVQLNRSSRETKH